MKISMRAGMKNCKKKKKFMQMQNENSIQKIDLLSMSKGIVGKYGKAAEKQKKKSKQSYMSLGFEPGFVKALLKVKYVKHQSLSKKNKKKKKKKKKKSTLR